MTSPLETFRTGLQALSAQADEAQAQYVAAERALIIAFRHRGLKVEEIGQVLGLSVPTICQKTPGMAGRLPRYRKRSLSMADVARLLQEFKAGLAAIVQTHTAASLTADVQTAAHFHRYLEAGLTQRQMAEEAKVTQPRIVQLLCYHRFCLITAVIKIPEFRFRQYWKHFSDTQTLQSLKGAKHADERKDYEQEVFASIQAALQAGQAPPKPVKVAKPATVIDIQKAGKGDPTRTLHALRKETDGRICHA